MKKTPSFIYSIIGISVVLFLLGIIGWLGINGNALTKYFKEQVEMQVILHDNTRDEKALELEEILKNQAFVQSVDFISKEEAAEQFQKEWDEDFMELLDFNPLYSSLNIYLTADYVNEDSIQLVTQFLYQNNIVREVSYPTVIVDQMNSNFKKIGLGLGILASILFIAVVVVIDNTVRLAMFSNRKLIKTMQMVGATRWFIAKPFDMGAIKSGLISGIIAAAGIFAIRLIALNQLPELHALGGDVLFYLLLLGLIALGVLISFLSTHRAVIKYLKYKLDHLY